MTNEIKDKILKIIIITLSTESANNTIEAFLEAIEILVLNNYFSEEKMNKNINYLKKNIMYIYNNY